MVILPSIQWSQQHRPAMSNPFPPAAMIVQLVIYLKFLLVVVRNRIIYIRIKILHHIINWLFIWSSGGGKIHTTISYSQFYPHSQQQTVSSCQKQSHLPMTYLLMIAYLKIIQINQSNTFIDYCICVQILNNNLDNNTFIMTDQQDNSYVEYSFNSQHQQGYGPCVQIHVSISNRGRHHLQFQCFQQENQHFETVTFGNDSPESQENQSINSQNQQPSHYTYAGSSDIQIDQENEWLQQQQLETNLQEKEQDNEGLTLEQINEFPLMEWKKTHNYINKGEKCSFCLEQYVLGEVLRVVPCMHRFHKNCIDQWLINKSTCPLCKRNFQV